MYDEPDYFLEADYEDRFAIGMAYLGETDISVFTSQSDNWDEWNEMDEDAEDWSYQDDPDSSDEPVQMIPYYDIPYIGYITE